MTQLLEKQRPARNIGFGALAVIVVTAASVAGQLATYPNLAVLIHEVFVERLASVA